MKRLTALLGAMILVLVLVGCGSPTEETPEEQVSYEIALVTDSGMINDGGYSQVAWEAISEFGSQNGISHKYYKAVEATEESYKAAVDAAAANGAGVIIADGYLFQGVVYEAQQEYPDIKFILIDGEPTDKESGKIKISDNTMAILFSSEQGGYMAGYAAVTEGSTELGFIGDAKQPVIADYGYGFLQGANDAAKALGVGVNVKYHYKEEGEDRDDIFDKASTWYSEGTELIFACCSHVELPIIEAAEMNGKRVIACETDKSIMSDTILTSAVKDIKGGIEDALRLYRTDKFDGGEAVNYDISNDGVWLEMKNGRFVNFIESDYDTIVDGIKKEAIVVRDHSYGDINSLGLINIMVIEQ